MTSFRKLLIGAVLGAATLTATAAAAATPVISLSNSGDPSTLLPGQILIADFDPAVQGPNAGVLYPTLQPGFTLTLNGATVGYQEGASGYSGTLLNDATHYLTIPTGTSAVLNSSSLLSSFSLYMGSPDTYNFIRFIGAGYDETVSGQQMSNNDPNQSWSWGQRVNFDFGGKKVNQIILSSTANSFESDNWAVGGAGAVPEPATWAMMIMGFASLGAVLRRRTAAAYSI